MSKSKRYTEHHKRMYVKFASASEQLEERAEDHMDRAIDAAQHGDSKSWAKEHQIMIDLHSAVQRLQRYSWEFIK